MKSPLSLRPLFFVFAACLFAGAIPGRAADFLADGQAWYKRNQAVFEQANQLSVAGDTAAGNRLLTELADKDGEPIAAFMVANTLYGSDYAASYRLHQRAKAGLPNEPAVALEVAMEQHRRGEYAAAVGNYRQWLTAHPGGQFSALLADCLIRTGQLKEAVTAWDQAEHARNHAKIDSAIGEIYGKLRPHQRRGDLIVEIKKGDLAKLNDLILLDLHFDTDWWNADVFTAGLMRDLPLAAKLLGTQDPRYQQLALIAKLTQAEELSPENIRASLASAKLVVGPGAILPANSKLARSYCELAVNREVATGDNLWNAHQAALRARVAAKDRDALHLLSWLAASANRPELAELDRLGWEEWKDPEFVGSYMVGRFRAKSLTSPNDPPLLAAISAVKDDVVLTGLRLALAGEKNLTTEILVAHIKAEYRHLNAGLGVQDSSALDALFSKLGQIVGPAVAAPTSAPVSSSAPAHTVRLGNIIEFNVPAGWVQTNPQDPGEPAPPAPTIKFKRQDGRHLEIVLTLFMSDALAPPVTDLASLKRFNLQGAAPVLPRPDAKPPAHDLPVADGIGVYVTCEDPKLIGKPVPPGEFRIGTVVSLLLSDKFLVYGMILYDEKDSVEFKQAMQLVGSARPRAAIRTAIAREKAAAAAPKSTADEEPLAVISRPLFGAELHLPPGRFWPDEKGSNPGVGFFAGKDDYGVGIVGQLEKATQYHGLRSYWADQKATVYNNVNFPFVSETYKIINGWDVVTYGVKEGTATRYELRACRVVGDTWAHLWLIPTKPADSPKDLEQIVAQLQLTSRK